MSNWIVQRGSDVVVVASRVQCDTAAGNHAMSAWTQLSASCPVSAAACIVQVWTPGYCPTVLQIGIGSAGSEQVIATLPCIGSYGWDRATCAWTPSFVLPLAIPRGVRIAARWQAQDNGSGPAPRYVTMSVVAQSGRLPVGYSLVEAAGITLNDTMPTALTNHASNAQYFGAWTELVASTTRRIRGVCPQITGRIRPLTENQTVEIGIGASGSERPIARSMGRVQYGDWPQAQHIHPTPVSIPAGTRLSMRYRNEFSANYTGHAWCLLLS